MSDNPFGVKLKKRAPSTRKKAGKQLTGLGDAGAKKSHREKSSKKPATNQTNQPKEAAAMDAAPDGETIEEFATELATSAELKELAATTKSLFISPLNSPPAAEPEPEPQMALPAAAPSELEVPPTSAEASPPEATPAATEPTTATKPPSAPELTAAPEPTSAPEPPSAPEPSAPEPSAPEPSAPNPSAPELAPEPISIAEPEPATPPTPPPPPPPPPPPTEPEPEPEPTVAVTAEGEPEAPATASAPAPDLTPAAEKPASTLPPAQAAALEAAQLAMKAAEEKLQAAKARQADIKRKQEMLLRRTVDVSQAEKDEIAARLAEQSQKDADTEVAEAERECNLSREKTQKLLVGLADDAGGAEGAGEAGSARSKAKKKGGGLLGGILSSRR